MKYNRYLRLMLCLSALIFICCEDINDDCLPEDIRQKFERERNGEVDGPDLVFSDLCTINILKNYSILSNSCAFLIDLSGTSKGYKYFFAHTQYSETEVRNTMKVLEYIDGTDYNFASTKYGNNGEKMFLYVVGYADEYTYGPIVAMDFYCPNAHGGSYFFDDKISGLSYSIKDVISITFPKISYSIRYRILFDDEADYAHGLSEAEAVLYAGDDWEYIHQTSSRTISMDRESHYSFFVITRVCTTLGDNSYGVRCFYQKLS